MISKTEGEKWQVDKFITVKLIQLLCETRACYYRDMEDTCLQVKL